MRAGSSRLPVDLAAADPGGMLDAVLDAPDQWARARRAAGRLDPTAVPDEPRAVAVLGMGGSGIAGDVAAVLAAGRGTAPVVPVRGYRLPAWVGPEVLVIAVSHSGETVETLTATQGAVAAGAPVVAVTTGGRLGALAEDAGLARVVVEAPEQPRASLPALTVPVLIVLEHAGVLSDMAAALAGVPEHLAGCLEAWAPEPGGAPLDLADRLAGATPWFLGARGLGALLARRARCQVNENAERVAHDSELPEADHNEIVGWAGTGPPGARAVLVELRHDGEDPRVAARFAVTRRLARGYFAETLRHDVPGSDVLTRLAAGIGFVDLLSVELALLAGVDPTPVAAIDSLKRDLERRR